MGANIKQVAQVVKKRNYAMTIVNGLPQKERKQAIRIFEYATFATIIIYLFGQVTPWALFIAVIILCISVPLHTWRTRGSRQHPLTPIPQQPPKAKTVRFYPLASELDDQP